METTQLDDHLDTPTRRLWTPWRMRYVGGGASEVGCLFCNGLQRDDDVASLILHRSAYSFAIMNLFPYNSGHIMLVPNEHVASPEEASADALREIADLLPPVLRALRRVFTCHGFNVGLNIGSIAGAGVAEHMHQHVVPRWNGDANFMPILGGATVMPELIPVTYAKIRAELHRVLCSDGTLVRLVVLDETSARVLIGPDGSLPTIIPVADEPIWRTAVNAIAARGIQAHVSGWAGTLRADVEAVNALMLRSDSAEVASTAVGTFVELNVARSTLRHGDAESLEQAIRVLE